jgi:hypothetical protein
MENEIKMNIEQKILEQIWDTLMKNDYPENFNFATDLRYDHLISYNPDNPTISLVVVNKGIPTKYEVTIREVA